jgi:hypothetical protein
MPGSAQRGEPLPPSPVTGAPIEQLLRRGSLVRAAFAFPSLQPTPEHWPAAFGARADYDAVTVKVSLDDPGPRLTRSFEHVGNVAGVPVMLLNDALLQFGSLTTPLTDVNPV